MIEQNFRNSAKRWNLNHSAFLNALECQQPLTEPLGLIRENPESEKDQTDPISESEKGEFKILFRGIFVLSNFLTEIWKFDQNFDF